MIRIPYLWEFCAMSLHCLAGLQERPGKFSKMFVHPELFIFTLKTCLILYGQSKFEDFKFFLPVGRTSILKFQRCLDLMKYTYIPLSINKTVILFIHVIVLIFRVRRLLWLLYVLGFNQKRLTDFYTILLGQAYIVT